MCLVEPLLSAGGSEHRKAFAAAIMDGPYTDDFNLQEFFIVNHGRNSDPTERWTLARVTEVPKLVQTERYGMRWQCKVMLYTKNGNARSKAKYIPERRKGTPHGWETVFCESLAFLAKTLPGSQSNTELTAKHLMKLDTILAVWDNLDESEQEEEEEEEEEERREPRQGRKRGRDSVSEEEGSEYEDQGDAEERGSSAGSGGEMSGNDL
jgi:hypothetical protein